jgi:hypothetical protein
MNGRLEPWSTAPMASMARLSSSHLSANLDQSCRKAGMDDGIRRGSAAAQAFQIFKVPSMHLGSGGDQRLSASLATSEAEYLMASFN